MSKTYQKTTGRGETASRDGAELVVPEQLVVSLAEIAESAKACWRYRWVSVCR